MVGAGADDGVLRRGPAVRAGGADLRHRRRLGLVYAAARGRLSALAQPWRVWLVGVGGLFGYHALYFAALRRPAGRSEPDRLLWPLLIVLFSSLLPGERLRPRHVVGAALGFSGAATLFWARRAASSTGARSARRSVYALALGCAFVWSSYSVLRGF